MPTYKEFYRRHLPHWQPPGAIFFVTFRVKGSLPQETIQALKRESRELQEKLDTIVSPVKHKMEADLIERRMFHRWDMALADNDPFDGCLRRPEIAAVVAESIHHRDENVYHLLAYCVMPNHVHLLIGSKQDEGAEPVTLTAILYSLKRHTALEINKRLQRQGAFWQDESYDRVVRNDQELIRIINYIAQNPVKATLAACWQEWPWTYVRPEFVGMILP